MIQLHCDHCGRALRAKDEHAGRTLKCPNCANPITVPEAHTPIPAPAAATATAPATSARGTVATSSPQPPPAGQQIVVKVPQQPSAGGGQKSNLVAGLLAGVALVTGFSAHRFYLGRYGSAILQTLLCWGGLVMLLFVVGIIPLGIWLIWVLIDAFGGTKRMVRAHNQMVG